MAKTNGVINDNEEILKFEEYVSFQADEEDPLKGLTTVRGNTYWKKDNYQYNKFFEELYSKFKGQNQYISLKEFEKLIVDMYFEIKENPSVPHSINDEVTKKPLVNGHVLLPIYNVTLSSDTIQIGVFTVVKYQYIETYLRGKEYLIPDNLTGGLCSDGYFNDIPFVDIPVLMRDNQFGLESGKRIETVFINFLNYVLYSDIKGVDVVRDYTNAGNRDRHFIVSSETFTMSLSGTPIGMKHLDLKEAVDYIIGEQHGNRKVLDIVGKNAPESELETRIINAVNWIGMAVAEKNHAIAFTQAILAVECLLQYQQSGEPISKSIVASIGEEVAFLLGRDLESRKSWEKKFKQLYGIRSKISHGKSTDITVYEVLDAIDLAKRLVIELLTNPAFKSAKTIQMVNNHIEKMRYTYSAQEE